MYQNLVCSFLKMWKILSLLIVFYLSFSIGISDIVWGQGCPHKFSKCRLLVSSGWGLDSCFSLKAKYRHHRTLCQHLKKHTNIFFLFVFNFSFCLGYSQMHFYLGCSRLTMLWSSQVNSEGTQPYIHMNPFSPKHLSPAGCHITLSRVPNMLMFWLVLVDNILLDSPTNRIHDMFRIAEENLWLHVGFLYQTTSLKNQME